MLTQPCCLGDPSSVPLDQCQCGRYVLPDTMCSEPRWAKLAKCQPCQESSNKNPFTHSDVSPVSRSSKTW